MPRPLVLPVLGLLLSVGLLAGCDSADTETPIGEGIYGQWLLADAYFLDVSPTQLRFIGWSPSGACWGAVSEAPYESMQDGRYLYRFSSSTYLRLSLQGEQLLMQDQQSHTGSGTLLNRTDMQESDLAPRCTVP